MPVEISVVQVASLGGLIAGTLFLMVALAFGVWLAVKVIGFAGRFKSVGAERVNGIVQVKGVFADASQAPVSVQLAPLGKLFKEALDFEPTPEDLARQAEIDRETNGGVN